MEDEFYHYAYDNEGNLVSRQSKGPNPVTTTYQWDHRNRLIGAVVTGGSPSGTSYTYDAFDQWISRTESSSGETTYYVYDEGQIVLAVDGTSSPEVSNRYLWGPGVDMLLADVRVNSPSDVDVFWALTDHLGTVRDLARNNGGNVDVVLHRAYDEFGNFTTPVSTEGADTLFAFTGRPFDKATELQNNLHRWYDPGTGRWISEDPIGFAAGDANLYRYVGNEVTGAVDPSGLEEQSWWDWLWGGDSEQRRATRKGMARRRAALIEAGGEEANRQLQESVRFAGELPGAILDHAESCAIEGILMFIPGPADDAARHGLRSGKAAKQAVSHRSRAADITVNLVRNGSRIFQGATDDVLKYWEDYYRIAGRNGDDLSATIERLRKLGFSVEKGESAAWRVGTNILEFGSDTKIWELYEEALHYSVSKGQGAAEIADLTKSLRKTFRHTRGCAPRDAAEEIYVKSQLLLRLDLDDATRTLLKRQIEKLKIMGTRHGY
jgi:RHS repeat-associated protein